jgi:hypothetical protein
MRRVRNSMKASLTLAASFVSTGLAFEMAMTPCFASIILPGGLSAVQSNNDLVLSFPTVNLRRRR